MINDVLAARKISEISDQADVIKNRSSEMQSILYNACCYLELQFEKGVEFQKKYALYEMLDALESSNDKLDNMSGNQDFTDEMIDSVQDSFEMMELIVTMHKNTVRKSDACKRNLELASSVCYWLLRECKSQQIPIPKGYFLSKLVQKEGFSLKYPKPTDQKHGEEPTFDVTECGDWFCNINGWNLL